VNVRKNLCCIFIAFIIEGCDLLSEKIFTFDSQVKNRLLLLDVVHGTSYPARMAGWLAGWLVSRVSTPTLAAKIEKGGIRWASSSYFAF
jgi:hypothetical protein